MGRSRALSAAIAGLGALALIPAATLSGATQPPLAERVARLEERLSPERLLALVEGVSELRRAIRSLRGAVERQGHTLEQLEDRQRELYLDLDRRLSRLAARHPATDSARAGAATASSDAAELAAYRHALELLQAERYAEAIDRLARYLGAYPEGTRADNARYWLAEAYYITGEYERALASFHELLEAHPESEKRIQALLKIGFIHDALGDESEARQVLRKVAAEHRGTAVARLAEERLREIRARKPSEQQQ